MTGPIAPPPGPHGGDAAALAARLGVPVDDVLDLSVNLNPCAPDVSALVAAHAHTVRHYPDSGAATEALARAIGVDPGRVVLTNGGAEAIALVAGHLGRGRVDEPDFALYARHLEHIDPDGPRWRSNPHNPTGQLAAPTEEATVWDEAFYPLATGVWTRGDGGSIVLGSLTKVFACPGLRIGYVVTPDAETARAIAHRQPQWSVSSLACAVVPELLSMARLPEWAKAIADLRARLVELLAHAGLEALPSDAPFVLVPRATGVREHLARHGVLVRDTTSFGCPDGVRVAVPGPHGLERLAVALRAMPR